MLPPSVLDPQSFWVGLPPFRACPGISGKYSLIRGIAPRKGFATSSRRQTAAPEDGFCALCRWLRCATGRLLPSAHGRWSPKASRRGRCAAVWRNPVIWPERSFSLPGAPIFPPSGCGSAVRKSRLYKFRRFNVNFCAQVSANLAFWGLRPRDLYRETQPEGRPDVQARLVQGNPGGRGRGPGKEGWLVRWLEALSLRPSGLDPKSGQKVQPRPRSKAVAAGLYVFSMKNFRGPVPKRTAMGVMDGTMLTRLSETKRSLPLITSPPPKAE